MRDNKHWIKKINAILEHFNYSKSELEKKTGVGNGYIRDIERGKNKNPSKFINGLTDIFGINPNWLLNDEGEMFLTEKEDTNSEESAILKELEKIAGRVAMDTIKQQAQDILSMKIQLENLIQKNEYDAQEKRLANIETRQKELEKMYEEMRELYINTPEDTKPKKIIYRGVGASGIVTIEEGTLYPDGTFIPDTEPDEVKENSAPYYSNYKETEKMLEIPLIENLAAGIPVESFSDYETYPVPVDLIKGKAENYCVAKICGSSMKDIDIPNASYVLLKICNTPQDGSIMVIQYDDKTTLKLLHQNNDGSWELRYCDNSGAKIELKAGHWEVKAQYIKTLKKPE